MLTHIMVPVDGSELAERALPCAEHLARVRGPASASATPTLRAPRGAAPSRADLSGWHGQAHP